MSRLRDPDRRLSAFALIAHLVRLGAPYRSGLLLVGLALVAEMTFLSALPFSLKFIIDDGLIAGDHRLLVAILLGLALGGLTVSLIGLARDFLFARIMAQVMGDLRTRMFSHLQRLSLDHFSRTSTGDVLGRFSGDLASIEAALGNIISWLLLPGLCVIANTALLFWLDWRLALVAMPMWPLCLVVPRIFAARAVAASFACKQNGGAVLAVVQENVQSQPVIKGLGLEEEARRVFGRRCGRLTESLRQVTFQAALVERSAGLGIMLLQVLVLAVGAWMTASGMLSVGALSAFLALLVTTSQALAEAAQFVPTLVHAAGGMARVDEILAVAPKVEDRADAIDLPPLARGIDLDGVSFGYTDAELNLRDITVAIPAGASVAFVGASGSGKSTILSLLMRLYDPTTGRVTVDGVDLRTTTQHSLRAQMGMVFQDSFLFDTTIAENIRLGRLDATRADIEAAARAAEVHDAVAALPDGYDTVIGERGGRLSGGQRQRIAIARALVRDPRILVLDEATSALDPATEAAINATLTTIGRGRTVVSVTHRLPSATRADCIHVLDRGVLVESGRHAELLARDGVYAALWAKQSGFHLSEDGEAGVVPARLRQVPLFDQLDDATLALAAPLFVTEHHPQGRMVIHQGDEGDRFYILVRGSVEILVARDDEVRRVAIRQDGDHFGEVALMGALRRTASVRTLSPCTLLSLGRSQFARLMHHAPDLRARMEAVHSARLVATTSA